MEIAMNSTVLISLLSILLVPKAAIADDFLALNRDLDGHVQAPVELSEGEFAALMLDRDCTKGYLTLATEINEDKSEFRIIAERGASKILYVTDSSNKISGVEIRRKSRVAEDIGTLVRIAGNLAVGLEIKALHDDEITGYCVEYRSLFKRANLRISTLDDQNQIKHTYDVIVGPAEHWYLSADLILSNTKQLSYDDDTGRIMEREKPGSFYIGLNRKFGDVFTNYSGIEFYKNFSIKGIVKASKNPGESVGIGFGYTFDMAEIFVGRVWTRDDQNVGAEKLGTTDATVVGLSFNLTRALEWLKNDD
jgi:hypothetical protein